MPVTSPPLISTDVSDPPNRGAQEQQFFSPKMDNFLASFEPFKNEQNALASWSNTIANGVETNANVVISGVAAAAASEAAAELAETNAEAAAAVAQQAAGLTPDADFGMVLATTANTAVKTASYTAQVGVMQDVDTSGGVFAITTPASPTVGQWFGIRDYNQNSFSGAHPWLDYAADKIIKLAEDCYIDVNTVIFEYRGAAVGWCV